MHGGARLLPGAQRLVQPVEAVLDDRQLVRVVTAVAGPFSRYLPNGSASDALVLPNGLAVSADGRLAIVDTGANVVHVLPAGSY